MKKLIFTFGIALAAVGALWTLITIATVRYGGWNPQGYFAQRLIILVIVPSAVLGKAIGLRNGASTWSWWLLALVVNTLLCFALGGLMGAISWRLRKSSPITKVLAAAAIPAVLLLLVSNTPSHLSAPSQNSCVNNLRQIESAKAQWALEQHKMTNDTPTWEDVLPYLHPHPQCPRGGTYTLGRVDGPPSCTIPEHDSFYKAANKWHN